MERVRDGNEMVRQMAPRLLPGRFVFATVTDSSERARLAPQAQGMFEEAEGTSLILPAPNAPGDAYRQITLDVNSALDGVGLTAAVSATLADCNIPANIVAANHHDHVFVPDHMAEAALDALLALSRGRAEEESKE